MEAAVMRKYVTQIRREFWECRASFIKTPIVTAGVLIVLLFLGVAPWHHKIAGFIEHQEAIHPGAANLGSAVLNDLADSQPDPGYLVHGLAALYSIFVVILLLILTFYFVDALYSDRRDQSILFWKSMPVSEWDTIIAKLGAGVLGAPASYALAAVTTGAFFLLAFFIYAGWIWNIPVPGIGAVLATFFKCSIGLIFGWLLLSLWYLPVFCWLLFSSAFVRKTPFLMALGIPLAAVVLETWIFGSHSVFSVITQQFTAGLYHFEALVHGPGNLIEVLKLSVSAPHFWLGLIFSAALLPACVWLRKNRWEI